MLRTWTPLLCALLCACALPAGRAAPPVVVQGQLMHLSRIALPPGTAWVVELRDEARGARVAEQRGELQGRQLPVPFRLQVDPATTDLTQPLTLRAALDIPGQPRWLSEARAVDLSRGAVDLGTLRLAPVPGRGRGVTENADGG